MKAPSERHLEDWIVGNFWRFGFVMEAFEQLFINENEDDYHWINDDEIIMPFYSRILARQAQLPHGIPDLITTEYGSIVVVELKKHEITAESIVQCARYIHDLKSLSFHLGQTPPPSGINESEWERAIESNVYDPLVKGVVIGHSLPSDKVIAAAHHTGVQLVTYSYNPDMNEYLFTCAWSEKHRVESGTAKMSLSDPTIATIFEGIRDGLSDRVSDIRRFDRRANDSKDVWQ